MIKGEYILGSGIVADMITTIIGVSKGFTEGNSFGLDQVYIANMILLLFCIFTVRKDRKSWINVLMYMFGAFRFGVAIYNVSLIL